MHHKNIRRIIKKQLKKQYPNWKRLSRKQKKAISKAVLNEAVAQYDFEQDIQVPLEELIGIEEMAHFIDVFNSGKFIKFNSYNRSNLFIKNEELWNSDIRIEKSGYFSKKLPRPHDFIDKIAHFYLICSIFYVSLYQLWLLENNHIKLSAIAYSGRLLSKRILQLHAKVKW